MFILFKTLEIQIMVHDGMNMQQHQIKETSDDKNRGRKQRSSAEENGDLWH